MTVTVEWRDSLPGSSLCSVSLNMVKEMPRMKRVLHFLCCLRAAEVEVEDNEYSDLLERARLRRETWRQRELARLKIELESQGVKTEEVPKTRSLKKKNFRRRLLEESRAEIQQAFRATQNLDNDKAAGGEGAEMENEAEEKKRVLLQEEQEREREEQRVAGLMQIRRQKLRRAFEAEKVRQKKTLLRGYSLKACSRLVNICSVLLIIIGPKGTGCRTGP